MTDTVAGVVVAMLGQVAAIEVSKYPWKVISDVSAKSLGGAYPGYPQTSLTVAANNFASPATAVPMSQLVQTPLVLIDSGSLF